MPVTAVSAVVRLALLETIQVEAAIISTHRELVVFIVDADEAVRDSIASLVTALGGQPYCFDSGEACLQGIDDLEPECLITEVSLPGMSGMDLFARFGARLPKTPTIFLALRGSVTAAVRAMRSGAVDYIEKPFIDRQLADRIRELCHLSP